MNDEQPASLSIKGGKRIPVPTSMAAGARQGHVFRSRAAYTGQGNLLTRPKDSCGS